MSNGACVCAACTSRKCRPHGLGGLFALEGRGEVPEAADPGRVELAGIMLVCCAFFDQCNRDHASRMVADVIHRFAQVFRGQEFRLFETENFVLIYRAM